MDEFILAKGQQWLLKQTGSKNTRQKH